MDVKFCVVLILSTLFSYEAHWSTVAFALLGCAIALAYFWRFVCLHKIFGLIVLGFTGFLIIVNLFKCFFLSFGKFNPLWS